MILLCYWAAEEFRAFYMYGFARVSYIYNGNVTGLKTTRRTVA
jgi:hypothetical protein